MTIAGIVLAILGCVAMGALVVVAADRQNRKYLDSKKRLP